MSPTTTETKLPTGYTLEPRHTAARVDERPILRDREGRTLATVERWLPDFGATN